MKFLIIFIIAIAAVVLIPHKSEYTVKAQYTLVDERAKAKVNLAVMPVDRTFETATTALGEIPNDYEWNVIAKQPYAQVIAQIYKGESNYGRADICRSRGLANGFGFAEPNPLENGPTCYDSFETVVSHVNNWIHERVQEGFSLSEMNCYYIRGVKSSECSTSYKLN